MSQQIGPEVGSVYRNMGEDPAFQNVAPFKSGDDVFGYTMANRRPDGVIDAIGGDSSDTPYIELGMPAELIGDETKKIFPGGMLLGGDVVVVKGLQEPFENGRTDRIVEVVNGDGIAGTIKPHDLRTRHDLDGNFSGLDASTAETLKAVRRESLEPKKPANL